LHAFNLVVRKAFSAPKPRPDNVMIGLYAQYRDGDAIEKSQVVSVIIELARLVREEQETATEPRFTLATRRRNAVVGGGFFR
jgi:hypothetical protein